ncbi:MAG TPA: hypothetical protein VIM38_11570 [Alphaproteobacteria bacterium]|jgi:hypothetical protein
MKHPIVATALCVFVLAPGLCFAQTGGEPKPIKPGSVRITTRAPELDKWTAQKTANGLRRVFRCKPLACAEPQTVAFTFLKSPTGTPDPKALEKFAKIDLPKSIRAAGAAREVLSDGAEKIETLSSKTTTLKGYPSVINETLFSRGKSSAYIETAIIFAGPVMIRVQSSSPNRQLAQKSLDQFIEAMRIEEGPPPSKPRPPSKGTQSL